MFFAFVAVWILELTHLFGKQPRHAALVGFVDQMIIYLSAPEPRHAYLMSGFFHGKSDRARPVGGHRCIWVLLGWS